jgi:peroxiredoxin
MENLRNIFKDDQLAVITIDVQEERDIVENFIKKEGYSFAVYLDSDGDVASRYNVRGHPQSFLIDPAGEVIGLAEGFRQWDSEAMIALFRSLINPKG